MRTRQCALVMGTAWLALVSSGCAPSVPISTTAPAVEEAPEPAKAPPIAEKPRVPQTWTQIWSRAPKGGWASASVIIPSGDVANISRGVLTIHARHDGQELESTKACNPEGPRAIKVMGGKLYLACSDKVVEVTLPGLAQRNVLTGILKDEKSLFREAAFGGDKLVFTHNDGAVEIYNTDTWSLLASHKLPKDTFAQHIAVSSDGQRITISNKDAETIHLFDDKGTQTTLTGLVEVLAFSPDGSRVFGKSGSFQAAEVTIASAELGRVMEIGSWITDAKYFGAGMLAVAGSSGISVMRLADGDLKLLGKMTAETLAIGPEGKLICGADRGKTIACYALGEVAPSTYPSIK